MEPAERARETGVTLGPPLRTFGRRHVLYEGRKLLFFGGIDYHRMSCHPGVIRAVAAAARTYGLTSGGSRSTTGNHPLYGRLEQRIAEYFGVEDAAVFGSGYLANLILLQAVGESYTHLFIDESAHSSMKDALRSLQRDSHPFKHADAAALSAAVRSLCGPADRPLVLTDGVFAARGEIPPLADYATIVTPYGGKVLIDDAHGVAVVGKTGKGSAEEAGLPAGLYLQTGTLSKGFGVFGGFIPGPRELIRGVREKSAAFTGSTGLPLPLAAGAIRSVDYLASHPGLITDLQRRSQALKAELRTAGFGIPESPAPIVSITHFQAERNERLRGLLLEHGIYPPFIHYPGAPQGGHFRFAISSAHRSSDIRLLADVVESSL